MSSPNKNIDSSNTSQKDVHPDSTKVTLYSFPEQGKGEWRVQDDVVMGGRSESGLQMTDEQHAHFYGRVSLKNNGGFCSIHRISEKNPYEISGKSVAYVLLLKGDGKDYNFRVRTPNGRHSYGFTFTTKGGGEWETISIPFEAMEANFRGRSVPVPNYAGEDVLEMQLLIGNKKEESFEIFLDTIGVI